MKKYYFLFTVIPVIFTMLLIGCKPKQALVEKQIEITKQSDSTLIASKIAINKAINDSLKIVIGELRTGKKECDSVCQATVDRLLSQLNQKKTSGENSSHVFYNPKDKTLNIDTKVGQTQNKDSLRNRTEYKDKFIYLDRPIEVEKPLAKWQLFLMYCGGAFLAYLGLRVFIFAKGRLT